MLDPFFQEGVERTAEFAKHLFALRKQMAEDLEIAQKMAQFRGLEAPPLRNFQVTDLDTIWGYPDLLNLVRLIFHRQVSSEGGELLDRPRDRFYERWGCVGYSWKKFLPSAGCHGCSWAMRSW